MICFFLLISFSPSRKQKHYHKLKKHHNRNSRNSETKRFLGMLPSYADDVDGSFLIPKKHDRKSTVQKKLDEQDLEMHKLIGLFSQKKIMTDKIQTINRQLLSEQEAQVHELLMDLFNRLKTKST